MAFNAPLVSSTSYMLNLSMCLSSCQYFRQGVGTGRWFHFCCVSQAINKTDRHAIMDTIWRKNQTFISSDVLHLEQLSNVRTLTEVRFAANNSDSFKLSLLEAQCLSQIWDTQLLALSNCRK